MVLFEWSFCGDLHIVDIIDDYHFAILMNCNVSIDNKFHQQQP